jgi:hypothetical protein
MTEFMVVAFLFLVLSSIASALFLNAMSCLDWSTLDNFAAWTVEVSYSRGEIVKWQESMK